MNSSKTSPPTTAFGRWSIFLAVLVALFGIGTYLDTVKHHAYIFDPDELHAIVNEAIAEHAGQPNATRLIIDSTMPRLAQKYGSQYINMNEEWVFNNAGGAMGHMYIVHASITEYIIWFGTPLGTEGHSGRFLADDYFNIIEGEQWAFKHGSLVKEVYPIGSLHHLRRGEVKQYKMQNNCFALEYVRGWVPLMLPFGFVEVFTSTLDVPTMLNTFRISLREMARNLLVGKL